MNKGRIIASLMISLAVIIAISPACAREQMAAPPKYVNPAGDRFPVVAYHAFNDTNLITLKNYRYVKDAGFTIAVSNLYPEKYIKQMLDYCEANDLKLIANCWGIQDESKIKKETEKYKGHKALGGILVFDEPKADKFSMISKLNKGVLAASTEILAYVNLLPNFATAEQLGAKDYKNYLESFVDQVNPQFISYDNYSIYEKDGKILLRKNFFENLEIAREVSEHRGIPFWTFVLSSAHLNYPSPDEGQISFQVFSSLAYGSQGIQYYGYAPWSGVEDKLFDAPMLLNGKRTDVWKACKKVNKQIHAMTWVFLGAKVKNVWHTGGSIPQGTRRMDASELPEQIKSIESWGEGVVVSHFTNGDKNFLMIVNRDFEQKQKVTIRKDSGVKRVKSNGKVSKDNSKNITLSPGGYYLYTW